MPAAFVNSWKTNSATTGVNAITLPISGPLATSGNALIGVVGCSTTVDLINAPTDYTLIERDQDTTESYSSFYKTTGAAASAADDMDPSWTDSGRTSIAAVELSGVNLVPEDSAQTPIATTVKTQSTGSATLTSSAGMAVAFLFVEGSTNWVSDAAGTGLAIDNGFTIRVIEWGGGGGTRLVAIATKALSSAGAVSANWTTTEAGADQTGGAIAVFGEPAATGNWTLTNMSAALDAAGLSGEANSASTITATGANGTVVGEASSGLVSQDHTARFFLKRKTGTGTIEITSNNGTNWLDVTTLVDTPANADPNLNDFVECLTDHTGTTLQIGVRLGTSGDEVIVGNGEAIANFSKEEVDGILPLVTFDSGTSAYAKSTVEQQGSWNNTPTWQSSPAPTDFAIQNYDATRWSKLLTNPYGAEEVSNGTFNTDLTDWAVPGGSSSTILWNNAAVDIVRNSEDCMEQTLSSPLSANKTYVLTFDILASSNTTSGYVYFKVAGANVIDTNAKELGSYSYVFSPSADSSALIVAAGGVGGLQFTLDNISIKEILPYLSLDELITNGGFDTDSDWTKGSGWTIAGGVATIAASSGFAQLTQDPVIVNSGTHQIQFDITRWDGSGGVRLVVQGVFNQTIPITGVGTYTATFTAVPNDGIGIQSDNGLSDYDIDNVSVKEVL